MIELKILNLEEHTTLQWHAIQVVYRAAVVSFHPLWNNQTCVQRDMLQEDHQLLHATPVCIPVNMYDLILRSMQLKFIIVYSYDGNGKQFNL